MKNIFTHQSYRTMSGIGFVALAMAGCANIPAPTEQLAVSKVAVSNATSSGGNEFASVEMRAAQDKLDRAVQAMVVEDYKNARYLAEQAEVDAQLAAAKARAAKAQQAALTIKEDSHILRNELDRKTQDPERKSQ